jgi:hypothetical protein
VARIAINSGASARRAPGRGCGAYVWVINRRLSSNRQLIFALSFDVDASVVLVGRDLDRGPQELRAPLEGPARDVDHAVYGGQANGIQALDRSRQIIALCGDGGFNMLMGEFLTAVHHKLPVKVIVYNNSSLGLIVLEAEGVGFPAFREAIEFPTGFCRIGPRLWRLRIQGATDPIVSTAPYRQGKT